MWLNLLYPGVFEFKVLPDFSDKVVFRSIIDADNLREAPSLTYAKHSSRTQANWTLVGQVTAIYMPEYLGSDDEEYSDNVDESEHLDQNMRDALESVFDSIKPLEDKLLVSATRTSVVATPLAIYQETSTK